MSSENEILVQIINKARDEGIYDDGILNDVGLSIEDIESKIRNNGKRLFYWEAPLKGTKKNEFKYIVEIYKLIHPEHGNNRYIVIHTLDAPTDRVTEIHGYDNVEDAIKSLKKTIKELEYMVQVKHETIQMIKREIEKQLKEEEELVSL